MKSWHEDLFLVAPVHASATVCLRRVALARLDELLHRHIVNDLGHGQEVWRLWVRGARDVREGALARVGKVQPLCEHAAVQRNNPAVYISDFKEAQDEVVGEHGVIWSGLGWKRLDYGCDLVWRTLWCLQGAFDLDLQRLALADAACHVELGGRHTISRHVDVVGIITRGFAGSDSSSAPS